MFLCERLRASGLKRSSVGCPWFGCCCRRGGGGRLAPV